jgi:hypothetical protein
MSNTAPCPNTAVRNLCWINLRSEAVRTIWARQRVLPPHAWRRMLLWFSEADGFTTAERFLCWPAVSSKNFVLVSEDWYSTAPYAPTLQPVFLWCWMWQPVHTATLNKTPTNKHGDRAQSQCIQSGSRYSDSCQHSNSNYVVLLGFGAV